MSREDVELVEAVFGLLAPNQEVDMGTVMQDDAMWEGNRDSFAPEVRVRFVTPGSGIEVMDRQEFVGIDGLKEGWRLWMQAWDYFRVTTGELIDVGDGQVLFLGQAAVRARSSGVDLTQGIAVLDRIADGRIVSIGFYLDQAQARRDAGLER